jgi:hypothetical protein
MLDWIILNKELMKIFYLLLIGLICTIIVFKSHRLFKISEHQGIRYFRNAFFFYGIAFLIRYFLGALSSQVNIFSFYYGYTINVLFEFFLVMAGFFLLYSLLWKRFENVTPPPISSLFNPMIILFYGMALIIVILDFIWATHNFMFVSQIIIFIFAIIISYGNYVINGAKGNFLKFYFIAMILSFITWVLNFAASSIFNWSQMILMAVYGLNIIMFLLFLYGVIKITK